MGSSGGGSFKPPNIPAPAAGAIAPPGQATPYVPQFVNFLGDTNVPSTGLTPAMLAAIDNQYASQQQAAAAAQQQRQALAAAMAPQQPKPQQGRQRRQWVYQDQGGDRGNALRKYDMQMMQRR